MSPKLLRCDRMLAAGVTAVALLALFGPGVARGDDRDLLRQAVADPYLFILLDTSGSMNWSPKDTASCPTGDCYVPMQADDPGSKFYQAKQALYEVITGPSFPKSYLGFGTYNQDALSVKTKHWLYKASNNGVPIPGAGFFPASGATDVFGLTWACDTGSGDNKIGCSSTTPANLTNTWDVTRVRRLPKGGFPLSTSTQTDFYILNSSVTYKVRYQVSSGTYGSNLVVSVNVWKCTNSSCSNTSALVGSPTNVTFTSQGDFLSWDFSTSRTNPQLSYFPQATATDSSATNGCSGWDPNDDTNSDKSNSYSLRYPTATPQDSRGADFTAGDIVPMDWKVDQKQEVLRRLAPNTGAGAPNYGISSYFKDSRVGSETFLRLKDENQRPLIAQGSTPIGASFLNFKTWYTTWSARAKDASKSDYDSSFNCRNKFLLILTDGDESCSGDPCAVANQLRSLGVTVFVVAFGVTQQSGNSSNKLNCMADADHTFFPQDKDQLIADLQKAVAQINEDTRAFASAAVPSVQAEVADRIYLSSFRPVGDEGAAYWDGHLDSYLKPLPLKNGKPNAGLNCPAAGGTQPRTSCHLWDAGTVLVTQAPSKADLAAAPTLTQSVLRMGLNTDQRRVFYPKENTTAGLPSTLRLLVPPTGAPASDPDWSDLWKGFNLPTPITSQNYTDTKNRIQSIMKSLLATKTASIQQTGLPDLPITYVLGDIFHADPVVIDHPNDFTFYSNNTYGNKGLGSDCVNDTGYRCYAKKHQFRRKLLLVGANDGQLHAFDGGVWVPDARAPTKESSTKARARSCSPTFRASPCRSCATRPSGAVRSSVSTARRGSTTCSSTRSITVRPTPRSASGARSPSAVSVKAAAATAAAGSATSPAAITRSTSPSPTSSTTARTPVNQQASCRAACRSKSGGGRLRHAALSRGALGVVRHDGPSRWTRIRTARRSRTDLVDAHRRQDPRHRVATRRSTSSLPSSPAAWMSTTRPTPRAATGSTCSTSRPARSSTSASSWVRPRPTSRPSTPISTATWTPSTWVPWRGSSTRWTSARGNTAARRHSEDVRHASPPHFGHDGDAHCGRGLEPVPHLRYRRQADLHRPHHVLRLPRSAATR